MRGENLSGRWISVIHRYRKAFADRMLKPCGVTGGQYLFILALNRYNGASQEQISDFLKIDKTTTARAIKKLEKEGFVSRTQDKTDKRAYQVYLTPKAQDIVPQIRRTMREWEDIVTVDLSDEEYAMLETILEKMAGKALDAINGCDL